MRFSKMHACGNDYIYCDAWRDAPPADPSAAARTLSDRHRGIGADGLIVIGASAIADARMWMYNADGSRAQMCGNGLRCAVRLAWDHGHLGAPRCRVETDAGVLACEVLLDLHGRCHAVRVAMGAPRFTAAAVPVHAVGDETPLRLAHGVAGLPDAHVLGMGNPHAVLIVDDPDAAPVTTAGPTIERHPAFPERCNVGFLARRADRAGYPVLRQRTWERGSGETMACGTGACAAAVVAMCTGLVPIGPVTVVQNGGEQRIDWNGRGPVLLEGEAVTVFTGDV